MAATYFTSDLHFGHVNILKYTDRATYLNLGDNPDVSFMNERLVQNWNDQVGLDDTVYVLGDFAMGRVLETVQYAKRLNGHKHLIMGNHDRPHPIMHKSDEQTVEWFRVYHEAGFESIKMMMIYDFDGVTAHCHHFPYTVDHTDNVRYMDYRPPNIGLPLVHGHVHDMFQTDGPQYNVGIDAWQGRFHTPEKIGAYFRSAGFGS